MLKRNRVVVTGMGVLAPNGIGLEAFWNSLVAGRSGVGPITHFDASSFKSRIAGEVKGFEPAKYLAAKEIRRFDSFIHYGLAAAIDADRDLLSPPPSVLPHSCGDSGSPTTRDRISRF